MGDVVGALPLLSIPTVPLVLAVCLLLRPRKSLLPSLAPWAAVPALVCSFLDLPVSDVDLPWLLLGTQLGIDRTARTFLFFTGLLWLAGGVFAAGYLERGEGMARFFVYFQFAMAGNLGLVVAQDMLSFYLFFALMSFASYGLIVHNRTADGRRAGRIYIVMVVAGEVLLFAALVMAAHAAGSLLFAEGRSALGEAAARDLIVALALAGFGIKLGVLGLHVWLPLAHTVAPTPASAILSGAMIKAGLLGWIRLLPLGDGALPFWWGTILVTLGLLAVFYAALAGIAQRNPKTVLAYSSVGQMGLVTIAVGLGLAVPSRWPEISTVVLFLALHHALAKSVLFLGVGIAATRLAADRRRWLLVAGLLLPALALAGVPFTSGGLVKEVLKAEALTLPAPWGGFLQTLLSWTLVATVLLMARFLYLTWPRRSNANLDSRYSLLLPWIVLIAALLLAPFSSELEGAEAVWTRSAVLSGFGMLALAVAGAVFGAWVFARLGKCRIPLPPPGDLVVPAEAAAAFLLGSVNRCVRTLGHRQHQAIATLEKCLSQLRGFFQYSNNTQLIWTAAFPLFFLLILVSIGFAMT